MLKSPVGPLQEIRDDILRKTLVLDEGQYMDEETFREAWGTELSLYAYDATDQVKDWWRQWGYMITQCNRESGIQVSISMGNRVSSN
jgi:salicylate hydroxylase